jgi:hypothetical protein
MWGRGIKEVRKDEGCIKNLCGVWKTLLKE